MNKKSKLWKLINNLLSIIFSKAIIHNSVKIIYKNIGTANKIIKTITFIKINKHNPYLLDILITGNIKKIGKGLNMEIVNIMGMDGKDSMGITGTGNIMRIMVNMDITEIMDMQLIKDLALHQITMAIHPHHQQCILLTYLIMETTSLTHNKHLILFSIHSFHLHLHHYRRDINKFLIRHLIINSYRLPLNLQFNFPFYLHLHHL